MKTTLYMVRHAASPFVPSQERTIPVIESILKSRQGQSIVVGTHGNIMTIIMNNYDPQYGYSFWKAASMPDIYRMSFVDNRLEQVERMWSGP